MVRNTQEALKSSKKQCPYWKARLSSTGNQANNHREEVGKNPKVKEEGKITNYEDNTRRMLESD